jgi:hypothetical protein
MRKRTVKLCRLHDGRKLYAGTIEAADPRELVLKVVAVSGDRREGGVFREPIGAASSGLSRRSRATPPR